jgi:hypothetical protein
MLHLLFQSIEAVLGRSLSQVAGLVYWTSLLALIIAACLPMYRLWRDHRILRAGVNQRWVMTCGQCQRLTLINTGRCDYCEADLALPWSLKRRASSQTRVSSKPVRYVRFSGRLVGSLLFIGLSVWLLVAIGTFAPEGPLHQLLIGVSVLTWTALGRLTARTLRLEVGSIPGRFTDAVLTVAALGALSLTLFLTDAARSQQGSVLAYLTAGTNTVAIGPHQVSVPNGEVRYEYLQLDHDLLGYHRILPLALSGSDRVLLTQSPIQGWVTERLGRYADGRIRRGLVIRRRAEHLRIIPGEAYRVIQRGREVLVQRLGEA